MSAHVIRKSHERGEPGAFQDSNGATIANGLAAIDELMAGGEVLPSQLPSATHWSPEMGLAAAVLASGLVEIRDHFGSRAHRRSVAEAIEWVESNDADWPLSFLRLCAVFSLEVDWVRQVVRKWIAMPREARKPVGLLYRHAA